MVFSYTLAIALTNRTTLPLPTRRGSLQIANALTDNGRRATFLYRRLGVHVTLNPCSASEVTSLDSPFYVQVSWFCTAQEDANAGIIGS